MATRCPGCATAFRVTPQQLQAHQGQVRCGHCKTVFDGFRELTTLPGEPAPEAPIVPQAGTPAVDEPLSEPTLRIETGPLYEPPPQDRAQPAIENPPEAVAARPAEQEFEVLSRSAAEQDFDIMGPPPVEQSSLSAPPEPGPAAAEPRQPGAPEIPEFGLEPIIASTEPIARSEPEEPDVKWRPVVAPNISLDEETEPDPEPPARRRWPWAVGSALMLLLLLAQAAYLFRSDLAVQVPLLKAVLGGMCALAGCSVPLPQEPELINIEASDLQAVDPARPGLIALTATLRNHADHDVGFPALDLVLTNTREHTLARRIFLPSEYLDSGRDADAGIPAKAEVTVRLNLETGDLGAAGFRLDLLAAPRR